jgi:murein DD-endopeptidase MepM/ murein hydrolase activator NlpD
VRAGDVIAKMGSTGRATGDHVHFEVWRDGKAVNPSQYIKAIR